jgi:Zn-dependent protease
MFSLGRWFGVDIVLDYGALTLMGLFGYQAFTSVPYAYPGHEGWIYIAYGTAVALSLFLSVLLHEFAHVIMAGVYGIRTDKITFNMMGGQAHLNSYIFKPLPEFLIAGVGPFSNVLIYLGLTFLASMDLGLPPIFIGLLKYAIWLNLALAIFNCIPAFPLDGGRMVRAIFQAILRDWQAATNVASLVALFIAAGMAYYAVTNGQYFLIFLIMSLVMTNIKQFSLRPAYY